MIVGSAGIIIGSGGLMVGHCRMTMGSVGIMVKNCKKCAKSRERVAKKVMATRMVAK